MKYGALLTLALLLPAGLAHADATTFRLKKFAIAGSDNFQAYALNDKGVIVGTTYNSATGAVAGLIINGQTITALPSPNKAFDVPKPEAINDEGEVLAWARNTGDGLVNVFLFDNGAYNKKYETEVEYPFSNNQSSLPNPFGFGNKKQIFFTAIVSFSDPTDGSFGTPPKFHHVPAYNRYNTVKSMNRAGVVAGYSYALGGQDVIFTGRPHNFTQLMPPGAILSKGGYINNSGSIAGIYADGSNVQHGFVYNAGSYTSFDMPEAASSILVTGINDRGRVVGTYVGSTDNHQHGFLYNGIAASSFGMFNQFDTIGVSINNKGKIILWDQRISGDYVYQSFKVTCSGSGC